MNYLKAREEFMKVTELGITAFQGYLLRGLTSVKLEDFDEAIKDFTNCINNPEIVKPNKYFVFGLRGNVFKKKQLYQRAR